jgi:hypothetical protein
VVAPGREQLALGVGLDVVGVLVRDPPHDQPSGDLPGFGFANAVNVTSATASLTHCGNCSSKTARG